MSTNPLRDMVIKELVRPEINANRKIYMGIISNFDKRMMMVDIKLDGVESDQDQFEKSVPVAQGAWSPTNGDPVDGDRAIVSYMSGDYNSPYVISIFHDGINDMTGKDYMLPAIAQSPKSTADGTGGGFSTGTSGSSGGNGGGGAF